MPTCASCGNEKPRADFSKAQFKKPADSRNCKACCGSTATPTVQVVIRCYHCKKVQPEGEKFFQCRGCRSITYCGKKCAKADWHAGHKDLCGSLNIGDAEQVIHKGGYERTELSKEVRDDILNGVDLTPQMKKFYDLFLNSAGQNDAQLERTSETMKKWFRRQPRVLKKMLAFESISLLLGCPTKMLKLPTSPLTIALSCHVDPTAMSTPADGISDGRGITMLHLLAQSVDGSEKSSFKNQVKIGQQLIDAGANVNARAERFNDHTPPLHLACHANIVTNLDFIKLMLENGADVNAQNDKGETPLMHSMPSAVGAAKLLVRSKDIDLNIKSRDGRMALPMVQASILDMEKAAGFTRDDEHRTKCLFIGSQLKELEELMVARGAQDNGAGTGYDARDFSLRQELGWDSM